MVGNESHGSHYPGLLDRTPALSLEERMVTVDDGRGGEAKRRLQIFMFDEETHRASRYIPLQAGPLEKRIYPEGCCLTCQE